MPTNVFVSKNGTVAENIEKALHLAGGIHDYINATDIVILKCNAQWPNQGYTNTECIKEVIDAILAIPSFSGEILICDNIQNAAYDTDCGFLASVGNRTHNWADHNWSTLAAAYQGTGDPVAIFRWENGALAAGVLGDGIANGSEGEGWVREFFSFHGINTYLSYPCFESPLTAGKIIDPKNGIYVDGELTGQAVKTICMPTLNNHGSGSEDYAGVTSAIKCFFGMTEIHTGDNDTVEHGGDTYYHIHSVSYTSSKAEYAGELAAHFINNQYAPVLYITCAEWSGHHSRTGAATQTKTILICENPATLDYVSCRDVISPISSWLDPTVPSNTTDQIDGCITGGVGDKDDNVVSYDFNGGTMALVQSRAQGSATTSLAYNSNNTIHNTLVVCVLSNGAIGTPTDTQGNTWVDCGAGNVPRSAGLQNIAIYTVKDCAAGANTVAVAGANALHIMEWSGLDIVTLVDKYAGASNASGAGADNISAGPITTDNSGDLIIMMAGCNTGPLSQGTGFTISPDGDVNGLWVYTTQVSAGAITGYITDGTSSDPAHGLIVALKAAADSSEIPVIMNHLLRNNQDG